VEGGLEKKTFVQRLNKLTARYGDTTLWVLKLHPVILKKETRLEWRGQPLGKREIDEDELTAIYGLDRKTYYTTSHGEFFKADIVEKPLPNPEEVYKEISRIERLLWKNQLPLETLVSTLKSAFEAAGAPVEIKEHCYITLTSGNIDCNISWWDFSAGRKVNRGWQTSYPIYWSFTDSADVEEFVRRFTKSADEKRGQAEASLKEKEAREATENL
jgi:hypothetical protein